MKKGLGPDCMDIYNQKMEKARISESEWFVMEQLWTRHPKTAADVVEGLQRNSDWKGQTIRTMLARLVKKRFVRMYQKDGLYLYEPLFDRDQVVEKESEGFLNRVFAGSRQPLLLHFVEKGKLSRAEKQELLRALKKMDTSD